MSILPIRSQRQLAESLPSEPFNIKRCNCFRLDRNDNGGDILIYVRDDIPCELISMLNSTTEGFFIASKLRKKKGLLCCSYNPPRRFVSNYLINIEKKLFFRIYLLKVSNRNTRTRCEINAQS